MTQQKTPDSAADGKALRKRRDAERLASALRDNLRRRKDQARARQDTNGQPKPAGD